MIDEVVVGMVPLHGIEIGTVSRRSMVHVEMYHVICEVAWKKARMLTFIYYYNIIQVDHTFLHI